MMRSLAIIPARGGSKRIPGKNIRAFLGLPIIYYPIRAALDSGCFDEVMVSTDDEEIARIARSAGAIVPFMRTAKNADDFARTEDVLCEVLEGYGDRDEMFDLICCIYPLAALLTAARLREGHERLLSNPSLAGVTTVLPFSHPIERALRITNDILRIVQPEKMEARSQDLDPAYHDAGQCYWLRVPAFLRSGSLWGQPIAPLLLSEIEAQDVDNETDWQLAELKYRLRAAS